MCGAALVQDAVKQFSRAGIYKVIDSPRNISGRNDLPRPHIWGRQYSLGLSGHAKCESCKNCYSDQRILNWHMFPSLALILTKVYGILGILYVIGAGRDGVCPKCRVRPKSENSSGAFAGRKAARSADVGSIKYGVPGTRY
jgi:hypothetical protein